ncbi:hypothetical protein Tco_0252883 [Tanacetum coccineum]
MSASQDEIPPPAPPPHIHHNTNQQIHTVLNIKLAYSQKRKNMIFGLWKMKPLLASYRYPIWEVIQNGNGPVSITTDTQGQIKRCGMPSNLDLVEMTKSKKMQKYILKQQFEGFSVSNSEGLHKGYDRFQSLLSQLEIHGAGVSTEDANQKFLRSLPSAWSQVSLIMRTKPGVDSLSFDDLYNNLRVFESDVKGSTASSSSPQNVAFVSENTSSTK